MLRIYLNIMDESLFKYSEYVTEEGKSYGFYLEQKTKFETDIQ